MPRGDNVSSRKCISKQYYGGECQCDIRCVCWVSRERHMFTVLQSCKSASLLPGEEMHQSEPGPAPHGHTHFTITPPPTRHCSPCREPPNTHSSTTDTSASHYHAYNEPTHTRVLGPDHWFTHTHTHTHTQICFFFGKMCNMQPLVKKGSVFF